MRNYSESQYFVESNDDKCWIHHENGLMMGRLCKVSGEIFTPDGMPKTVTSPQWSIWKKAIKKEFNINIPDNMRPKNIETGDVQ